jgi:hypothetical protein
MSSVSPFEKFNPKLGAAEESYKSAGEKEYELNRFDEYKDLEGKIDQFFTENPIFYQFKPSKWFGTDSATAYKDSFTQLSAELQKTDSAAKFISLDEKIKSLIEKLHRLEQSETSLSAQTDLELDSEHIKIAAIAYIKANTSKKDGIFNKFYTAAVEGISEIKDTVTDISKAKKAIENTASALINAPRQIGMAAGKSIVAAGQGIKESFSDVGHIVWDGRVGEKLVELRAGINASITGVTEEMKSEVRSFVGREGHTPKIDIIKALRTLSQTNERDNFISLLNWLEERDNLKTEINTLFISPEYQNLIPQGPYRTEGGRYRCYFRTWHAPLSEMIKTLEKTSNCLDNLVDTENRKDLDEQIKHYNELLDKRDAIQKSIKAHVLKADEMKASFATAADKIKEFTETIVNKIVPLNDNMDRNVQLINEGNSTPELRKTIAEQELQLSGLLTVYDFCKVELDKIEESQKAIADYEKIFKNTQTLVCYLNVNDDITDKLNQLIQFLRGGKENSDNIGSLEVVFVFDAGLRAGPELGILNLNVEVGMTLMLSGSLSILDTREIMFKHRLALSLWIKADIHLGTPREAKEFLKELSIPSPPELLTASAKAKCSLLDIAACHIYKDEDHWAAHWSHQVTKSIVFLNKYTPADAAAMDPAWLNAQMDSLTSRQDLDTNDARLHQVLERDAKTVGLLKVPYKIVYFERPLGVEAVGNAGVFGSKQLTVEKKTTDEIKFMFSQGNNDSAPQSNSTPQSSSDELIEVLVTYPFEKPAPGQGKTIYHKFTSNGSERHYLEVSQKITSTAGALGISVTTVADVPKSQIASSAKLYKLSEAVNFPDPKSLSPSTAGASKTDAVEIPPQALTVATGMSSTIDRTNFPIILYLRLKELFSGGGKDVLKETQDLLNKAKAVNELVSKDVTNAGNLITDGLDQLEKGNSETIQSAPINGAIDSVKTEVLQGQDTAINLSESIGVGLDSALSNIHLQPSQYTYLRCVLQPQMKQWPLDTVKYVWVPQVFRGYSLQGLSLVIPKVGIPILPGLDATIRSSLTFTREVSQYEVLGTNTFSYLIMLNKNVDKTDATVGFNIDKYISLHWPEIEKLLENVTDTTSGAFAELWQSVKNRNKDGNVAARKLGKACFEKFRPNEKCPFIFIDLKYIRDTKRRAEDYNAKKLAFDSLVSNKIDAYNKTAVNLKKMTVDLTARRTKLEELLEQYNTVEALYNTSKKAFLTKFNDKVTHKIELVDLAGLKQYIEKIKSYTGYQSHQLNIRPNLKSIREAYVSGKTSSEIINGARDELLSFYKLSLGIDTPIHDDKNLLSIDMAFCEAFNKEATIVNRTNMKRSGVENDKYLQMSNDYWKFFATSLLSQKNINLIEKTPPKNSILSSFSKKEFNKSVGSPININPLGRFIVPDMDGPHAWDPDRGVYVRGLIMWKSNQTHALRGALTELEKPLTNVPDPFKHANLEYYNNVPEESRNRFTTYFDRRLTAIDTFLGAIKNWKKGKEEETSNRMPNVVMLLEVPGLLEKLSIIRMQLQSALRWEIRTQMQELDQLNKTVPVEGQGIAPIIVPVIKPEEDLKELLMAYLNESNDRFEHEPLLHGLKQ